MGYRAHVCKTYTVEYGVGQMSHLSEEVNNFLLEACFKDEQGQQVDVVRWYNCEDPVYSDELELNPEGLKMLIDTLRSGELDDLVEYRFSGHNGHYSASELADVFQSWLDNYDKNNNFIRIAWF